MAQRVYLPGKGARGLDMPSGERYDEQYPGAGYVEVDDLHADVLKGFSSLRVGERFYGSTSTAPEVECPKCGRRELKALSGKGCRKCKVPYVSD